MLASRLIVGDDDSLRPLGIGSGTEKQQEMRDFALSDVAEIFNQSVRALFLVNGCSGEEKRRDDDEGEEEEEEEGAAMMEAVVRQGVSWGRGIRWDFYHLTSMVILFINFMFYGSGSL